MVKWTAEDTNILQIKNPEIFGIFYLNPNYAIEFVARLESAIKQSVPARFYDTGMVTPISRNKTEETLEIEAISRRSRISNA